MVSVSPKATDMNGVKFSLGRIMVSSNLGRLRGVVPVTLDRMARVYDHLTIPNLHRENIHRAWRRTTDNLTRCIKDRAVAGTVELPFLFAPGHGAAEVRAAATAPGCRRRPSAKCRSSGLDVADGARLKLIKLPGHDKGSK
jgi:hypothetical protein